MAPRTRPALLLFCLALVLTAPFAASQSSTSSAPTVTTSESTGGVSETSEASTPSRTTTAESTTAQSTSGQSTTSPTTTVDSTSPTTTTVDSTSPTTTTVDSTSPTTTTTEPTTSPTTTEEDDGGSSGGGCCDAARLTSEGGFGDEWERYLGVWERRGTYQGKPFYECPSCQGLDDELIFYEGVWEIVDCFPDDDGCNGIHEILYSSPASDDSCPDDDIGPWTYCDGNFIPGGGCDSYAQDVTVGFVCQ